PVIYGCACSTNCFAITSKTFLKNTCLLIPVRCCRIVANQVRTGDIDTGRAGPRRVRSTEYKTHAVKSPGAHRVATITKCDFLRAVIMQSERVGMAATAHCSRLTHAKRLAGYGQRAVADPALDEGDVLVM